LGRAPQRIACGLTRRGAGGKRDLQLNASVITNESSMERPIMKKLELKTSDQVLQVALAKEKESRDFYDEQAAHCRVEFVRKLLEKLKDEESKHIRLVQGMIRNLNVGRDIV
jgi:rubrerythrin